MSKVNDDAGAQKHQVAVPVAFDEDGLLVRPENASPDRQYRCPGCRVELTPRKGKLRRPHFAHRRLTSCSAESALHRAAKHLLVQVIIEWKERGGPKPAISRPCPRFSCNGGVVQDLPDDVTHARAEVRLADGQIADVVLFRGEKPAAAVEILVTHAVDSSKAARMMIPWVELRAKDLLDLPYWWVADQDGLEPFVCPACSKRRLDATDRVRQIQDQSVSLAARLGLQLPPSPPYHFVPHTCWRCGVAMVAFLWPGGGDHSPTRPPSPIPPTLRHCVTEGAGDYWANCCPQCSSVQGDYYLARDNESYGLIRELSREWEYG